MLRFLIDYVFVIIFSISPAYYFAISYKIDLLGNILHYVLSDMCRPALLNCNALMMAQTEPKHVGEYIRK
jgi:hypothetical protein